MPIENLRDLKKHFDSIVYVSYMTVQPEKGILDEYVQQMSDQLLDDTTELWLIGRMVEHIDREKLAERITIFNSITELVDWI